MRMPTAAIALLVATGTAQAHPGHGGPGAWHHGEPALLALLAVVCVVAVGAYRLRAVRARRRTPGR
jgi:hypothetical protein